MRVRRCEAGNKHKAGGPVALGNPTRWRGVPVASIQKSFGSSGQDWKPWKKLPIPCKFCTYRFIRYPSTCCRKVRVNPLMANIRNPDFSASRWRMPPGLLWFGRVIRIVRKLPRATTNLQKNKSYVGLFISYVGLFISYVGLIKSYVGLYNSYVGDKISHFYVLRRTL